VVAVGLSWKGGNPEEVGDEEASRSGVDGSTPGLDLWEKQLPWPWFKIMTAMGLDGKARRVADREFVC
jgi:hypothetical protein